MLRNRTVARKPSTLQQGNARVQGSDLVSGKVLRPQQCFWGMLNARRALLRARTVRTARAQGARCGRTPPTPGAAPRHAGAKGGRSVASTCKPGIACFVWTALRSSTGSPCTARTLLGAACKLATRRYSVPSVWQRRVTGQRACKAHSSYWAAFHRRQGARTLSATACPFAVK